MKLVALIIEHNLDYCPNKRCLTGDIIRRGLMAEKQLRTAALTNRTSRKPT